MTTPAVTTGAAAQQQQQQPQGKTKPPVFPQRQQGERIGTVLILTDGRRIVLDQVKSYAPGGDCGIHFTLGPGATLDWRCPMSWKRDGKLVHNPTQQERQQAADDVLEQIDSFFKTRDLRGRQ